MPEKSVPEPSGFVIVRLEDWVRSRDDEFYFREDLRDVARAAELPELEGALRRFDPVTALPLLDRTERLRARKLEESVRDSPFAPQFSLTLYWRLDLRGRDVALDEVVEGLRVPGVGLAYAEVAAGEPAGTGVTAGDDTRSPEQHHLDDSPVGIGARRILDLTLTVPVFTALTAVEIRLADVERGWRTDHEDLRSVATRLVAGDRLGGVQREHGTSVLGVVVAGDNTVGVIGIAPWAAPVLLASHHRAADASSGHVAQVVTTLLDQLRAGDVLLLEVERGGYPTEIDDADLQAIRLASARGVTVVEPAGNGAFDLGAWQDPAGVRHLDPGRADGGFVDSGAVMVGSCTADPADAPPAGRSSSSSFGARVDCCARGENIVTTGRTFPAIGDVQSYTEFFDGTSGASAIVAGAALVLQSLHEVVGGARLPVTDLRTALGDPATGVDLRGEGIGVMPDLVALAAALTPLP